MIYLIGLAHLILEIIPESQLFGVEVLNYDFSSFRKTESPVFSDMLTCMQAIISRNEYLSIKLLNILEAKLIIMHMN